MAGILIPIVSLLHENELLDLAAKHWERRRVGRICIAGLGWAWDCIVGVLVALAQCALFSAV